MCMIQAMHMTRNIYRRVVRHPGAGWSYPGVRGSYPGVRGSYPGAHVSYPGAHVSYPGAHVSYPGANKRCPRSGSVLFSDESRNTGHAHSSYAAFFASDESYRGHAPPS